MLSFHVDPKYNSLDSIICHEPVDPEILDKLINSDLSDIEPNKHVAKTYENEKIQLIKYQQLLNDNNEAIVKYERSMKYGRSNPKFSLGLFMIRRQIRHTLASERFIDIDIDNAHPSMLRQICKSNNICCEYLSSYIENRQQWFDLVNKHWNINNCNKVKENKDHLKDIPKNLFIRLMYSGGVKKWVEDHKLDQFIPIHSKIQQFCNEVEMIARLIASANPELYKIAYQKKYEKAKKIIKTKCNKEGIKPDYNNIILSNVDGTTCSYVMQEYESRVLETMYNFLIENNCIHNNICVLCADGIMIEKQYYYNNILIDMEEAIYNKTNFKLKLSTKPMLKGYNNILNNHLKPDYVYLNKNSIKINSKYLINENDNNNMKLNVNHFFNSNIKVLNVKSPYGTGKTTMLKYILSNYCINNNNKRILYLSYRKTLSMDLYNSFKDYNFVSYREFKDNNKLRKQNRLIIQVESLYKLEDPIINNFMLMRYIPTFDIIIIDETESVLNQYQSTQTFKDKARETFELMTSMCKSCNKIIALDGDMSERAYRYLHNFGNSMNIINIYQTKQKYYELNSDIIQFRESIFNDLKNGHKVVLVSMSSVMCDDIILQIKKKFPYKKIKCYTALTDDEQKQLDFDNVNETWSKLDFLCYSPTIEAGVDFNKIHFTKMYGYICSKSCSARSFMQMMGRIRYIKSDHINILNETLPLCNDDRTHFDAMCNALHNTFNIEAYTRKEIIINDRYAVTFELQPYNINYIYNMLEKRNSNFHSFVTEFSRLCLLKGHDININIGIKVKVDRLNKLDKIISAKDVNSCDYKILMNKQLDDKATEIDKLQIGKYIYQKQYGIKHLNKKLIYKVSNTILKNYIYLSDERNIPKNHYHDMTIKKTIIKVNKIRELIIKLGFNNIYSDIILPKNIFDKNIKKNCKKLEIFNNINDTKLLFEIDHRTSSKPFESDKSRLAYLNVLLHQYSVKIESNRKGHNKIPHYKLIRLENIDEIMLYKKLNGHKIYIRPDSIKKCIYDYDSSLLEGKLNEDIQKFNKMMHTNVKLINTSIKLIPKT